MVECMRGAFNGRPTFPVCAAAVAVVVMLSPSAAQCRGRIAFSSVRDDGITSEIYVMNDDGSDQRRLTWNTADDQSPDWSPDGSRIVFVSTRDGDEEIYVMEGDGSNQVRLTQHPGHDTFPRWSPDGTRIAYTSAEEGNWSITIMGADGSNPAYWMNLSVIGNSAAWSPDASKIAWASGRIYVAEVTGSATPTPLTPVDVGTFLPAWSPDGSYIAYTAVSEESTGAAGPPWTSFDLFVVSAEGGVPRRLTYEEGYDGFPAWSPDGTRIAFWSDRLGGGIYSMAVDGTSVVRLTDQVAPSAFSWSAGPRGTPVQQTSWGVLKALMGQ